jgi:hypothetical protein
MDARVRRGGAHAVCDRAPLVSPWISRHREARRNEAFTRSIARGTTGTIRSRPVSAVEATELLHQLPAGYGRTAVLIQFEIGLDHTSRSKLRVDPRVEGAGDYDSPDGRALYALFDSYPPSPKETPPRKDLISGSMFVLTLGIVDVGGYWDAVFGRGSKPSKPSKRVEAGRKAVARFHGLNGPQTLEPGQSVTHYALLVGPDVEGSFALRLAMTPIPGDCIFLGRRFEETVVLGMAGPDVARFDGRKASR